MMAFAIFVFGLWAFWSQEAGFCLCRFKKLMKYCWSILRFQRIWAQSPLLTKAICIYIRLQCFGYQLIWLTRVRYFACFISFRSFSETLSIGLLEGTDTNGLGNAIAKWLINHNISCWIVIRIEISQQISEV